MNGETIKKSNLCASVGFLLTLFNLVVSLSFIITGNKMGLLIFSSVTAALSLMLCFCGKAVAKRAGKGKVLSIIGIVINALLLAAALALALFLVLSMQSSDNV